MEKNKSLALFENKRIRRTQFNEEWWFVAIDIVEALTDSKDPSGYLKDMRRRDEGFKEEQVKIATPLKHNFHTIKINKYVYFNKTKVLYI